MSICEGINRRSNYSFPFSEYGSKGGTGINKDSGISKAEGYLNFSDEVEINLFLASFNNCLGSRTPGFKGDEGFPRVPIFFEATVTAEKVIRCSLYQVLLILFTLQNQFQIVDYPGKISFPLSVPRQRRQKMLSLNLNLDYEIQA